MIDQVPAPPAPATALITQRLLAGRPSVPASVPHGFRLATVLIVQLLHVRRHAALSNCRLERPIPETTYRTAPIPDRNFSRLGDPCGICCPQATPSSRPPKKESIPCEKGLAGTAASPKSTCQFLLAGGGHIRMRVRDCGYPATPSRRRKSSRRQVHPMLPAAASRAARMVGAGRWHCRSTATKRA